MGLEQKMAKLKKEFGEGLVFKISYYVYWFLLGNLYFALFNIPLIVVLFMVLANGTSPLPQGFNLIIFISCIPLGPASAALFSVMGKLIRTKDLNITKDFIKAYKVNFNQSLILWTFEMVIIVMIYVDTTILLVPKAPSVIIKTLYIFIVLIFMVGLFILPILSRFHLKAKDIIRLSIYYTIRKINITLLNFIISFVMGYIIFKSTIIILVFIPSIFCFLIMYIEQKILLEIERSL
jgi:uncharacterized membrane protein YesL